MPPNLLDNLISPLLVEQYPVLAGPQHHNSLSALPVQGVNCVMPEAPRVPRHTLRQVEGLRFGSAQKPAQYLGNIVISI